MESAHPATVLARRWQWLLIAGIAGWLLGLRAPILTPVVFAARLGWLGDPLVARLVPRGWTRQLGVVLVFCAINDLGL